MSNRGTGILIARLLNRVLCYRWYQNVFDLTRFIWSALQSRRRWCYRLPTTLWCAFAATPVQPSSTIAFLLYIWLILIGFFSRKRRYDGVSITWRFCTSIMASFMPRWMLCYRRRQPSAMVLLWAYFNEVSATMVRRYCYHNVIFRFYIPTGYVLTLQV